MQLEKLQDQKPECHLEWPNVLTCTIMLSALVTPGLAIVSTLYIIVWYHNNIIASANYYLISVLQLW